MEARSGGLVVAAGILKTGKEGVDIVRGGEE